MTVGELFKLYNAAIEGKTIICTVTEHYNGYDISWTRTYNNEVEFLNLNIEDLIDSDDTDEEFGFTYTHSYHIKE